jgi:hypothetical protein
MNDELKIALVGMAGGVIGGGVSGVYQHVREWLTRPRLSVDYETDKAHFVDFDYVKPNGHDISAVYVRVRIRNLGWGVAKDCRVFLTRLEEVRQSRATPTAATPTALNEALVLGWPGGTNFEPQDIPRGPHFYADVVSVSKLTPDWRFAVREMHANYLEKLPTFRGTYRFHVLVTCDDAVPVQCKIDVAYDGDWHNFRADPAP